MPLSSCGSILKVYREGHKFRGWTLAVFLLMIEKDRKSTMDTPSRYNL